MVTRSKKRPPFPNNRLPWTTSRRFYPSGPSRYEGEALHGLHSLPSAGAIPTVGESLMVKDTARAHHTTLMCCFPEMYDKLDLKGDGGCAANFSQVMEPYGVKTHLEVTDHHSQLHSRSSELESVGRTNYVQFEAWKDTVCAVSCCLYDQVGLGRCASHRLSCCPP